jgi:hypothetical protein
VGGAGAQYREGHSRLRPVARVASSESATAAAGRPIAPIVVPIALSLSIPVSLQIPIAH